MYTTGSTRTADVHRGFTNVYATCRSVVVGIKPSGATASVYPKSIIAYTGRIFSRTTLAAANFRHPVRIYGHRGRCTGRSRTEIYPENRRFYVPDVYDRYIAAYV